MDFQLSRIRSPSNQQDFALLGCAPEPMSSYLKALGILRAMEQLDSQAKGRWEGSRFLLRTACSEQDIVNFFLHQYSPSPACSPWNGTSGFWKDAQIVDRVIGAESPRFSALRSIYAIAKQFVQTSGLKRQPKPGNEKNEFVWQLQDTIAGQLTNTIAGNQWQEWSSAVMVEREIVTKKGTTLKIDMPKLLGTGGNIGNADLGFCFAQAIMLLWDLKSGSPLLKCEERIRVSLFGELHPDVLGTNGLTQFHPASDFYTEYKEQKSKDYAHAGENSTAASNPFDLVLVIEGLFLFSGVSCRRSESIESTVSKYSLAVSLNTALDPSSASDEVRGKDIEEIWLPIWENPVTAKGLREDLFERGRNRLPGQAVDSIDFATEVSQWGVDRTIDRFVRYGFLNRKGQANFSVCLGQFRPSIGLADFAAELRRYRLFMKRFCRRKEATPKLESLFNRLESAIFRLLGSDGSVVEVLVAIGALESYISQSGEVRKGDLPSPCRTLLAKWLAKALEEVNSSEARLALSLASCQIRSQLFLVARSEKGWWTWDKEAKPCWSNGSPINSLLELQQYWELNAKPERFISTPLFDISRFILQDINLKRFEELLRGFTLCSFENFTPRSVNQVDYFLPPLYAVCASCSWGDRRDGVEGKVAERTQALVRWLSLNQPDRAGERAIRLLRNAGYHPKLSLSENFKGADFNRILAASLAFPIAQYQIDRNFHRFL